MPLWRKIATKILVENLCGSRGNDADSLLMNLPRRPLCGKNQDFSEQAQNHPPHTTRQKTNQVFVSRTFPPIHSTHHNKKKHFSFLEKTFVKILVDVQNSVPLRTAVRLLQILGNPYFHSSFPLCGLYTLLKNEYSTL
jgi:hypothetical protein